MRNVTRPAMPASLRNSAARWLKELMSALSSPIEDKVLVKRCFNRYNEGDVREALEEMYDGLCCYCESRMGIGNFSEIEHRQPKKCFPELTFEWDNLHLACPVCNRAKGKKWDEYRPILDSVVDPISKHLSYRIGGGGAKRWPETERGKTTIDHASLNRQKLVDARTEISYWVRKTIRILNRDPCSPAAGLVGEELQKKIVGEYGSLVVWLLDDSI